MRLEWGKKLPDIFATIESYCRLPRVVTSQSVFYTRGQRYQLQISRLFATTKKKYCEWDPAPFWNVNAAGHLEILTRVRGSTRGMEMSGFINSCIYIWPGYIHRVRDPPYNTVTRNGTLSRKSDFSHYLPSGTVVQVHRTIWNSEKYTFNFNSSKVLKRMIAGIFPTSIKLSSFFSVYSQSNILILTRRKSKVITRFWNRIFVAKDDYFRAHIKNCELQTSISFFLT